MWQSHVATAQSWHEGEMSLAHLHHLIPGSWLRRNGSINSSCCCWRHDSGATSEPRLARSICSLRHGCSLRLSLSAVLSHPRQLDPVKVERLIYSHPCHTPSQLTPRPTTRPKSFDERPRALSAHARRLLGH